MKEIALVTVLFNSESVLEGFFKSLFSQSFKNYHLFIVDNTPNERTDVLLNELNQKFPISGFTHLKMESNVGVAKGNNQGIQVSLSAGYAYTLLLNNDIEFEQPYLLQAMYERAIKFNESMIIPKIFFYDSRKIWMAGGGFLKHKGIVYHVGEGHNDGPKYNKEAYFNYAPTCFMLINNIVFRSVGMMDEKYFVYYDDTDFVLRASRNGHKIFYMPNLTVLHKVSSSTGGNESLFSIYYANRNRIYFIRKHFRGMAAVLPMTYTLLTRMLRAILYAHKERRQMIKSLKDGFSMPITEEIILP